MKKSWRIASALWLAVCGCLAPPAPDTDKLHPLENQFEDDRDFADLPIPRGFALDTSKSMKHVIHRDQTRLANFVYRGNSQPVRVAQFYREQMTHPQMGWTLAHEERIPAKNETIALTFEKPMLRGGRTPEICKVFVERAWKETVLTVKLNFDDAPRKE